MLVEYLETEFATDKTLLFPKDCHLFASAMPLAKSKWPTHAQQNVLFDLRPIEE